MHAHIYKNTCIYIYIFKESSRDIYLQRKTSMLQTKTVIRSMTIRDIFTDAKALFVHCVSTQQTMTEHSSEIHTVFLPVTSAKNFFIHIQDDTPQGKIMPGSNPLKAERSFCLRV